jgi:hypothetical protein
MRHFKCERCHGDLLYLIVINGIDDRSLETCSRRKSGSDKTHGVAAYFSGNKMLPAVEVCP